MKSFKKIKDLWKKNQEESSEDHLERETLRKDLINFKKTLRLFSGTEIANSNGEYLERLILIQNMRMQKKMNSATDGLKTATWILAFATGIFAWTAIIDSPNSNYLIQIMQNIASVIGIAFISILIVSLSLLIIKFIWKLIKKQEN